MSFKKYVSRIIINVNSWVSLDNVYRMDVKLYLLFIKFFLFGFSFCKRSSVHIFKCRTKY